MVELNYKRLKGLENCFKAHGIPARYINSWFRNYDIDGPKQQAAFDQINLAIKELRPMALLGSFGGGKTHLATAMVKSAIFHRKDAWYYTLASLFRDYRNSLGNSEQEFFKKVSKCDLLVIDEFNLRSDSEAENRLIQEIIDSRYSNHLPTVFVANMTLNEFSELIGDRLVDRLKQMKTEIVIFNWKSYREKEVK